MPPPAAFDPRVAYDIAVFDFDGTIADTEGAIVACAVHALAHRGHAPRPAAAVRDRIGLPLPQVLDELAGGGHSQVEVDALCAVYRAHWEKIGTALTRPFAGMVEVIDSVRGAGLECAVATGRGLGSVEQLLVANNLRGHFRDLIGGYCVARGKPHPDMLEVLLARTGHTPARALVIGDTEYDMAMARSAGADAVGVTWGSHTAARLRAAGAREVFTTPAELRAFWRRG